MTKTQLLGPLQRDWISKLRSGDYAQTKVYLHDKDGYCCLGVALEHVLGMEPKFIAENSTYRVRHYHDQGGNVNSILPDDAMECLGLYSEEGMIILGHLPEDVQDRIKDDSTLAYLNDAGFSFSEIAGIIEANPKAVFKEPR